MPNSNRLCSTLDRNEENPHHFATFEVVSERRGSHQNGHSKRQSEGGYVTPEKPENVRCEVERVLDFYLDIEYFDDACISGRLDAGQVQRFRRSASRRVILDTDGYPIHAVDRGESRERIRSRAHASVSTVASTDRDRQLWKSTIGVKLKHLAVGAEKALIKAATLRRARNECRNHIRNLDQVLGSPSGSLAVKDIRGDLQFLKSMAVAMAEKFHTDRKRLVRSATYRDACMELYTVCSSTADVHGYCFMSFDEYGRFRPWRADAS